LHNEDGVISILNNWEGGVSSLRKRGQKIAKIILPVDDTLKEINNNCKKKWGERIPLPNTSGTFKVLSSSAIKKYRGSGSGQQLLNPSQPFRGKPLACSISKTVECSTRSKAFSKSSFRIIISLLEW
jgi:hypothetical protein